MGHLIKVTDASLYAEQRGDGPNLVLLHSSNADLRMWDDLCPIFARRYRTLRFDARGHGRSSPPIRPYAPHDDVHALLLALGIDRAILVGHSMGGSTALDYTLSHPEVVSALVVSASGPKGRPQPSGDLRDAWETIVNLYKAGNRDAALDLELKLWVDGPCLRSSDRLGQVRDRVALMSGAIAPEARAIPKIAPQVPAVQRLHEIRASTLAVVGAADQPWIIEGAKLLEAGIPGCPLVTIPGCAHMLPMEEPKLFTEVVLDFLTSGS